MARKKVKKLSECLSDILSLKVKDENLEFLEGLGIKKACADNKMLIAARLFERAASGEISAIKEIRSVLSETEIDTGSIAEIIEAVRNVR